MQRPRTLTALMVTGALLALAATPAALPAQSSTVRCESQSAAQTQCRIPASSQVTLARQISSTPCRERQNWGTGAGFIWVTAGCRADFTVTTAYQPSPQPVPPTGQTPATALQLRACQSEADRRLPNYSFNDIRVVGGGRKVSTTYVRWSAGPESGMCSVAANGRILQFTMNNPGNGSGGVGGGNGLPTTSVVTCQSKSTDRQECQVPQGAQVRLLRQVSQNPCRLNDTYGQGQGYVWVDKGCRAEFEVTEPGTGGIGGGNGLPTVRRIVCESQSAARTQCAVAGVSQIRLVRQISQTACRENSNYGTGFGHIWVSGGCRGEFEVTIPNTSGGGGVISPPSQRVTCESRSGQRTDCPTPFKSQVTLTRQLSTTPCRRNDTWGTTPNSIWVTRGCRGEFVVEAGGLQ